MHAAGVFGCLLALTTSMTSGFVIPGPSKVVSGRSTRASTSQVIIMGRGDMRTAKGKRKRHTYGVCRPRGNKKRPDVFYDGELVVRQPPVARRWEIIEYDEAALLAAEAAGVSGEDDLTASPTGDGEVEASSVSIEVDEAVVEEEAVFNAPEDVPAETVVNASSEDFIAAEASAEA